VAAPFYTVEVPKAPETPVEANTGGILINQWILIAALAGVLLLILIIILAVRHRRKKNELMEAMEISQEDVPELPVMEELLQVEDEQEQVIPEPEEDRGAELRQSVREFAEQNPEISAQLLKVWLNGGGNNGN